jgi:uncharacterized membrane-anchored protein YhcB (DUF1043 family)
MTKLADDLTDAEILILKDRLNQADPLKLVANLIAIMADAPRADKHIRQYQAEKASSERAKQALAEARIKHDQHIAESTAELDRSRAGYRKLERDLAEREGRLAVREERLKEREQADMRRSGRLEIVGFGGLSRERDLAPDAPDPHFGGNAA